MRATTGLVAVVFACAGLAGCCAGGHAPAGGAPDGAAGADRVQDERADDLAVAASARFPAAPPAPAAALVFAVPIASQDPPLSLSRAGRAPEAFVGFEDPIVEFHTVITDDRQGRGACGSYDRYERRAITEKVGVLHR